MGDSWSVGAWHTTSHYHCYHDGVSHYLREQGHSVTVIGRGGSSNIKQLKEMQMLNQDWDHIIWLWTDCLRNHDWYREHQPGIHNIYDIHSNQEQWIQAQITKRNPDLWSKIIMIGGCAPLMTEWPCKQLNSWCEAMGHIEHDHPTVDEADWRDFVQSFSHDHKQHHMDFLTQSEERHDQLVYGTTKPSYTNWHKRSGRKQFQKGMMGEDLHPNPKAHRWLTEWILNKIQD